MKNKTMHPAMIKNQQIMKLAAQYRKQGLSMKEAWVRASKAIRTTQDEEVIPKRRLSAAEMKLTKPSFDQFDRNPLEEDKTYRKFPSYVKEAIFDIVSGPSNGCKERVIKRIIEEHHELPETAEKIYRAAMDTIRQSFKKKNPLAKWETPAMHKRVKRCVKKVGKGVKSPWAICKSSVGHLKNPANPDYEPSPVDQDYEKRLDALFQRLVPRSGAATTVEGEMVRSIMRILYRYMNDGDYFFRGYGKETAGSSVTWLTKHSPLGKQLRPIFSEAKRKALPGRDHPYEYMVKYDGYLIALRKAVRVIVDYVEGRRQLDMNLLPDSRFKNPGAAWHRKGVSHNDKLASEASRKGEHLLTSYHLGKSAAHDESANVSEHLHMNPVMDIYLGVHKSNESLGTIFATKTRPTARLYPQYVRVYGPFSHVKHVMDFAKSKGISCNVKDNPGSREKFKKGEIVKDEEGYEYRVIKQIGNSVTVQPVGVRPDSHITATVHVSHMYKKGKKPHMMPPGSFEYNGIIYSVFGAGFKTKSEAIKYGENLSAETGLKVLVRKDGSHSWAVWSEYKQENPPHGGVEIYDRIESIEAQKGKSSLWPKEKFRHSFKGKTAAKVIGNPDGSLTIKSIKGKPLWKNFNYPERKRR